MRFTPSTSTLHGHLLKLQPFHPFFVSSLNSPFLHHYPLHPSLSATKCHHVLCCIVLALWGTSWQCLLILWHAIVSWPCTMQVLIEHIDSLLFDLHFIVSVSVSPCSIKHMKVTINLLWIPLSSNSYVSTLLFWYSHKKPISFDYVLFEFLVNHFLWCTWEK